VDLFDQAIGRLAALAENRASKMNSKHTLISRFRGAPIGASVLLAALAVRSTCAHEMVFPGSDWQHATPESEGVNSSRLTDAVEYFKAHSGRDGVRELIIVRNGRVIWLGDNVDKVHGVWSCTKSFTSTVLGLLIDEGKCTLETRAAEHLPELATHYPDVTLRHFTTMTSGYRAIGDEPRGTYRHGPSRTPFDPSPEPLFSPPGSKFAYWDSAMNMFALVLTRIAGEPLEELFRRRIADPIQMNSSKWDWGDLATIDGIVINGGSGNSQKHMFISARDMARFGHLYLNAGRWNGQQLISRDWVRQATSVQVPATRPWQSRSEGPGCYGFNWWTNGQIPEGQRKWPSAPAGTFAAEGHNNNRCFVVPEWNMVVVRLGLDEEADFRIAAETWDAFLGLIGKSLADQPARAEAPRR